MAINIQKLLPGSGGTQKALPQAKITTIQLTSQDKKNVNTIRVKTIQVDKILKGTLAADKKRLGDKKKAASQERRQKQESQLEKKPEKKKKFTIPKVLPRTGIWDWIKNFIGSIILGWFAYNMIEHADKLKGTLTTILNVTDFLIDWGGKLFNGLATFIHWGYNAFDWAKGVATKFGLEGPFNAFIGAVDKLITLLVAIAAIRALTPDWAKGKGPKPKGQKPKPNKPRSWQNKRPRLPWQKPKVSTGTGGKPKFKIPGTGPSVTKGGGNKGVLSILSKIPGLGFLKGIVGRALGPLFFLWDLTSRKGSGQSNVQAGVGAGSSWAGFTAGGTLAGKVLAPLLVAPFPGARPLYALGVIGGGLLGAAGLTGVADAVTGANKVGQVEGKSEGGVVNKKKQSLYIPKRKIYEVYPSAIDFPDEGEDDGKKGIWGKIKDSIVGAVKWITNPLGKVWRKMGDKFLGVKFFGPILTLAIKSLVGQKLTKTDYDDAGLGIASLLNKGLNDGDLMGTLMAAFAEGGLVSPLMQQKQKNVAEWISKQLQESLNVLSLQTSNDINAVESKDAKDAKESKGSTESTESTAGQNNKQRLSGIVGGRLKLTAEDWEYIARTVQGEAGPGDDQYYVAAAIINRMSDPRWYGPNASAKTVVSASGQFAGYHEGAPINAAQHTRLTSDGGQEKILQALQHLEGRTDFKGRSMYHNMGSSDVRPNDRSNFYHYLEQKGKNDPLTPQMKRDDWKRLVSGGGGGLEWNPLGWLSGNKGEEIAQVASAGPMGGLLGESQGPGVRKRGKGSKLAGELGRFLDKRGLGGWGSGVHQHPEHPPWPKESGHRAGSLHYESQGGRAIDIGGWGPMRYKREGMSGTDDQTQIIAGIRAWERGKNISQRAEFAHEGNDPTGDHDDHVHVAYHKGGPVPGKGERWAKLLGGEMVIDVDSAGPAKNLLLAINQASGPEQVMKAIQDYAPYEALQSRMIPIPIPVPTGGSSASSSRPTTIVVGGGGGTHDQFESLVAQG